MRGRGWFGWGGGWRRGLGWGGGMGLGFRGSSPPWPYVGLGRGGLPRCGYFLSGAAGTPIAYPSYSRFGVWPTPSPFYGAPITAPETTPFTPQMTPEQELDFMKNQAQTIKSHLEQIESRMHELEAEEK